mgnify:CR=1 FL=1
MLSIIVIAKNEEQLLPDCLKSLSFADELIVIDNNSTDDTKKIAKKFKTKVYSTDLTGWDNLHNFGRDQATGDWILYIDADERVSKDLKTKIQKIVKSGDCSAYKIFRQNIYLGKRMKFGGWGDDYIIRLYNKASFSGYEGNIHEQPIFTGKLGTIEEPLILYSHRDLYSMTEKTIVFTNYEAQNRLSTNHPPVVAWRFVRVMLTEFNTRFIRLSAWRDGAEGIIDGLFQVFNSFVIYARLWELQHEKENIY